MRRETRQNGRMTITDETTAAREYLEQLGWTQRGLAAVIGVHETRIRRMLNGSAPMDELLLAWLAKLAKFHCKNPPPRLDRLRVPKNAGQDERPG